MLKLVLRACCWLTAGEGLSLEICRITGNLMLHQAKVDGVEWWWLGVVWSALVLLSRFAVLRLRRFKGRRLYWELVASVLL